eukprot:CAMPEP_0172488980 /NCGR_PEP_ID=MMETSP1066-20121228/18716_1 /TAXON_ID=671091 /ORGANISM="Coscinodiscus wailesii, Strain CCMP2513" /LENGTH=145 /DNA_ID=CAMNT_0013256529 /DNA_START=113 /DNA_END=547 /DNA_ORIENTATION=-
MMTLKYNEMNDLEIENREPQVQRALSIMRPTIFTQWESSRFAEKINTAGSGDNGDDSNECHSLGSFALTVTPSSEMVRGNTSLMIMTTLEKSNNTKNYSLSSGSTAREWSSFPPPVLTRALVDPRMEAAFQNGADDNFFDESSSW